MNIIHIATILHSLPCSFSIFYMELLLLFMITITHLQTTNGKMYLNAISKCVIILLCHINIFVKNCLVRYLSEKSSWETLWWSRCVIGSWWDFVLHSKPGVQSAVAVRGILFIIFLDKNKSLWHTSLTHPHNKCSPPFWIFPIENIEHSYIHKAAEITLKLGSHLQAD